MRLSKATAGFSISTALCCILSAAGAPGHGHHAFLPAVPRQQQPAWKTLVPVPAGAIHEYSTVALSSTQLVIIGGVLQTGAVLDSVYLYDIPTNAWKKLAPLPVAINHANVAAVDGKIYVLGGMTGASWAGTPKSWVYDPAADKWAALAPMAPASETRRSAVVGVHNRTVWLASGKTGSGGESVVTVSAFDTVLGTWLTTIPARAKNIPAKYLLAIPIVAENSTLTNK
ncbi:hypothetical protein B0T24DRAFT_690526 [Lasiosphaeria ovina]|uniref:Galactose oxidase n=1 Tax=Lasiosphaeria ovina TaxID=92902 RepID=A0AAE0MYP7_9PEZI|nr:hypothetical protein B0T24DRAFT_690526 [Lasiosphaeria ovina]